MSVRDNMGHVNVCMISGSYPPMEDGVGDYTQILFHALRQRLKGTLLLTTRTSESEDRTGDGIFGVVDKWRFRSLPGIVRRMQTAKPGIVHIQYPAGGYGKNPAANFLPMLLRIALPKTKVVSTIHEFSNKTLKGKLRLLISIVACHKMIIVDQRYKRDIKKFWPFVGNRTVHIPVGSNLPDPLQPNESDVRKLRNSLGIAETAPVISYFGVIRPGKGIEFLLNASHKALQKYPEAKLLFIGRIYENYYEQSIKGMIEDEQLGSNVIFTGSCEQSEIPLYFALADMCVLPFEDGVSTKRTSFMAALQHNLPTITTKGDFLPDGLVDYENVILVKYGDEAALSDKMIRLIEDGDLRGKLRSNAGEVLGNYSWNNIAEKNINVYRSLTPKGNKSY